MGETYVKVSTNMLFSALWAEDAETCKVWVTVMLMADKEGVVRQNMVGISAIARISLEKCKEAMKFFESPDPESGTDWEEGRRLVKVEGGWRLVTRPKYQEMGWSEDKKRYERERKEAYRAAQQSKTKKVGHSGKTALSGAQPPSKSENAPTTPPVEPKTVPVLEQSVPEPPPAVPREPETVPQGTPSDKIIPSEGEPPLPEVKGKKYHDDARTVLAMLNELSQRAFRETDSNLTFISERLKEVGVTLDGVRVMMVRQCKRWLGTPSAEYLRPETLFNKTKFDAYYANREFPIAPTGGQSVDRNIGNANEGKAHLYRGMGNVSVPDRAQ